MESKTTKYFHNNEHFKKKKVGNMKLQKYLSFQIILSDTHYTLAITNL